MKNITKRVLLALVIMAGTQPLFALEVDREVMPRIAVDGRVLATLENTDSKNGSASGINTEDSGLLLRFDKRTYVSGVAGGVLGFTDTHDGVQLPQAHVFFWNQRYDFLLGKAPLPVLPLEFSALRDDDLADYTQVANGSSSASLAQSHGEVLQLGWRPGPKHQAASAWLASRADDAAWGNAGLDSHGLRYEYHLPENLYYVHRLRYLGAMLDRQQIDNAGNKDWMQALVLGGQVNLNENPAANWSLSLQALMNQGVDDISQAQLSGPDAGIFRARSNYQSVVSAVTYTARPLLLTRWRGSLILAGKTYTDVKNARQWTLAQSFNYMLGQGVELLGQIRHTRYQDGLGGGAVNSAQLGIAFDLGSVFNDTIGERDSIPNLEHGYIN